MGATVPRVRQAVLAARSLEPVVDRLRSELGLGEPFSDPAVAYFGLRNAVFALGDTFLEVVSPTRPGTAVGRLLERRGCECGYMVMFQVPDLDAARRRARAHGVREVFEVSLEDIAEVHLHPSDMRGAIVSLSLPQPPDSWRWGGPGWSKGAVGLQVAGVRVAVQETSVVSSRWSSILGGLPGVEFVASDEEVGLVEIALSGDAGFEPLQIGLVRLVFRP